MPTALLVEDDRVSRKTLEEWIAHQGCEPTAAGTIKQARRELRKRHFDLVLLDLQMPDGNGLELLEDLEAQPDAEIAIITGHATVDSALAAFRGGAVDFLEKPVDLDRLRSIVAHATRSATLRAELEGVRSELRSSGRFEGMIGASKGMSRVYDEILRVAPTDTTVFVTGETGTGKELVAEAIHRRSPRRDAPFISVNCGALSPQLIESELFGHERGSFTGATRAHAGLFEQADGGTLFLDELTEMPLEMQVKLLRSLEDRRIQRVGSSEKKAVDVRLVAATNRDPYEAVEDGKLREDLLYRLLVFPIPLPPLRQRDGDVDLLAMHFVTALNHARGGGKRLAPECVAQLQQHNWPGNVRELKNAIERAYIMSDGLIEALPIAGAIRRASRPSDETRIELTVGTSMESANRRLIHATLEHFDGSRQQTAAALGISLKTLYNRLNRMESDRSVE